MRRPMTRLTTLTAAILALGLGTGAAVAAESEAHVTDYSFSFEGPFGSFDQHQLQRGLQVYTEICAGCHGMQYVPIRTLGDESGPGLPEEQVRAYAEGLEVFDPTLNDGQGDFRPATPKDHFPRNTSVGAPDLSLMAKARAGFHGPYGLGLSQLFNGMGGPEYIASLLTGYTGEDREEAGVVLYENTAFPGGWISMAPPLYGDDVQYADGTEATLEQEAKDVAAFLMWAAEPKMMARKQAGFTGVLMLVVMTVLLYLTNKRVWAPVKRAAKETPAE
jgi:ubiquinol-cytochrome c reductase cytochrome c1 subunit